MVVWSSVLVLGGQAAVRKKLVSLVTGPVLRVLSRLLSVWGLKPAYLRQQAVLCICFYTTSCYCIGTELGFIASLIDKEPLWVLLQRCFRNRMAPVRQRLQQALRLSFRNKRVPGKNALPP